MGRFLYACVAVRSEIEKPVGPHPGTQPGVFRGLHWIQQSACWTADCGVGKQLACKSRAWKRTSRIVLRHLPDNLGLFRRWESWCMTLRIWDCLRKCVTNQRAHDILGPWRCCAQPATVREHSACNMLPSALNYFAMDKTQSGPRQTTSNNGHWQTQNLKERCAPPHAET